MILRILKSNTLLSSLLIPAIGIPFWMHSFRVPHQLNTDLVNNAMPLYYLIFQHLKDQGTLQVYLGFILVIFNSFFVAQLGASYLFLKKRSYLPGIIYLMMVSSVPRLHAFIPVHIATLLVLVALYFILSTYHNAVEITYTFNASFFLALGSLFYLPIVVMFPLIWISIFVLQKDDNWRLFSVPILGIGAPWIFMWTYAYLNDTEAILWKELLTMLWTAHNSYLLEPYFLIPTAFVSLLTILGSISVISIYHRMKVSTRKFFVIFYWMLGLMVIATLAFITIGEEIIALLAVPVVYFITHYLVSDQKYLFKEILTWIFVIIMASLVIYHP